MVTELLHLRFVMCRILIVTDVLNAMVLSFGPWLIWCLSRSGEVWLLQFLRRVRTMLVIQPFWLGNSLIRLLSVTLSAQPFMFNSTVSVFSFRPCSIPCCLLKAKRAPTGQGLIVVVLCFVFLLKGVYAGVRSNKRWSDSARCGRRAALWACFMSE